MDTRDASWGTRLDVNGLGYDGGYGSILSNQPSGALSLEQQYSSYASAPGATGGGATQSVDAYLANLGGPATTPAAQAQTGASNYNASGDYVPPTTISLPQPFAQYTELLQQQVAPEAPAAAAPTAAPKPKPAEPKPKPADAPKPQFTPEQIAFFEKVAKMNPEERANVDKFFATAAANEAKVKAAAAAPQPEKYTVVGGDNLTKIGQKYGVPWQEIYEANKGVIGGNPNLIRPGQVYVIPGKNAPAPAPAPASAPAPAPAAKPADTKKAELKAEIKKTDATIKEMSDKTSQWQMDIYDGKLSEADVNRVRQSISDTLSYITELQLYRAGLAKELGAEAPEDPNNGVYASLGIKPA